jgi:hypothetical protein
LTGFNFSIIATQAAMARRGLSTATSRKSQTWPMVKKYANRLCRAGGMHFSRKMSHS